MYLKNLSLNNFRNFESYDTELCDKINCFIGDNGIGKTNILDAIHYLSLCKSFLPTNDKNTIKYGEQFFLLKGDFELNNKLEKISCNFIKDKKKTVKRNDVEYEKLSEHIGLIPIVFSTPYDSNLIHLGSDSRRKFIDIIISQFDKIYLKNLIDYNKVLENRNILLKQYYDKKIDYINLESWDHILIEKGNYIFNKRKEFSTEIIDIFTNYYNKISNFNEEANLIYQSQLLDDNFETNLKTNFLKDIKFGYTTVGIHKDDFLFLLNNEPIRKNGSQGQQKSFIISLKFSQFDYIKKKLNIAPILLLDDIFDKLDKKRVTIISELVSNENFGQIFVSDTSQTRMPNILQNININNKIINLSEK
ncbi:MAG: DNA replication and repair protein RecF [Bacteroidales bacterium]|nr:DNA replication and repair protein RecF [Bacteroidales bacterium]